MAQGLYDRGYIIFYEEGDRSLQRDFLSFRGSVNNRFHAITDNDTLYTIAREYYKDSSYWYIIADANPEIITDIFDLPVGETILIPSKVLISYA